MRLRNLKWATVLFPAVLLWIVETFRHGLFDDSVPTWLGNLISTAVVLAVSLIFAQLTFRLIARSQALLTARNRELTRLNTQVKEMAILEERSRLAREMHDGLAQILAFVMIKVETVSDLVARQRVADAERELAAIRRACDDAYSDVRESIVALRTDLSDNRSFAAVVRETLDRSSDAAPFETTFSLENIPDDAALGELITPTMAVQLIRVVQEGLANVRKHAVAQHVTLTIRFHPAASSAADSGTMLSRPYLLLILRDDGQGFVVGHPCGHREPHLGLRIMRERVESLDGQFRVVSAPDQGTCLQIEVPCQPSPRANATGRTKVAR